MAEIRPATEADLEIIATQLGRVPRAVLGIAAYCHLTTPAAEPAGAMQETDEAAALRGHDTSAGLRGESFAIINSKRRGDTSPAVPHVRAPRADAESKEQLRRYAGDARAETKERLHRSRSSGGDSESSLSLTASTLRLRRYAGFARAAQHPAVIATAPRLPNGEPFPTFYYLTCPAAVAACSQLEAAGEMREAEALLNDPQHPEFAAAYQRAHRAYLAAREAASPDPVPEIANFSAGGMPDRVKCFHALLGHTLAAGPGVNPVGDWVLARLRAENLWSPETCNWRLN